MDADGIPLISSCRGTGSGEGIHRIFLTGMHHLHVGPRYGVCLLTEKRHRYNHRNASRTRDNYPRLGHCDTWYVDKYQLLCEQANVSEPYPSWANTCDFVQTKPLRVIIPLHAIDGELQRVASRIKVGAEVQLKADVAYLAKLYDLPLPFLPVYSQEERHLFDILIGKYSTAAHSARRANFVGGFDSSKMSIEFTSRANGTPILTLMVLRPL